MISKQIFSLNFMFLCSLIEEWCRKEESDETGCNINFGHECSLIQQRSLLLFVYTYTYLLQLTKSRVIISTWKNCFEFHAPGGVYLSSVSKPFFKAPFCAASELYFESRLKDSKRYLGMKGLKCESENANEEEKLEPK